MLQDVVQNTGMKGEETGLRIYTAAGNRAASPECGGSAQHKV